jgi:hypothetical protein
MAEHFTERDVWHGGAFSLVILAGSRSQRPSAEADARLDSVLSAVWAAPALDGPYARRDRAPDRQRRIVPTFRAGLFGLARLPSGLAPCTTQVVRDDPGEHDWVYVDLPLGGLYRLGLVVDGPGADAAALAQVRDLLLGVARAVYDDLSFEAAGIGHELLGPDVADYVRDRESVRSGDWLVGTPDGLSVESGP